MNINLRLTGKQHKQLKSHLFPGDNKEAVAIALCGRLNGKKLHCLLVREIISIPYHLCQTREIDQIKWSTQTIIPVIEEAAKKKMAILKIHSHPGGLSKFSITDDKSDRDLFSSIYGWMNDELPHASVIMLPDGYMFGRCVDADDNFIPLSVITVAGESIHRWYCNHTSKELPEFTCRHAQIFGKGTIEILRNLAVAVVGCSGIGSLVIEQLARLGVGRLVIIDPDYVEEKNLNRILNTTMEDALNKSFKTEVIARAIHKMGIGTEIVTFPTSLFDREAVKAVTECDIVFGCMDSIDGRYLLNRLATFYSIPYIDVGVKLEADGSGGIDHISGAVHYLQPDGSSLLSRKVYTIEQVRAAGLKRTNSAFYRDLLESKYIIGVNEDRPAVMSVNMFFASRALIELLARLHPYRDDNNDNFAIYRYSLTGEYSHIESDGEGCPVLSRHVGSGDITPLLEMPELSGEKSLYEMAKEN